MAKSWYSIRNAKKGEAEVSIYDEIGMWGIRVKDFARDLKALGDVSKITLRINSPGGIVFDGLAIHNLLKDHAARVTVKVDGIAASIASVIAMAGDRVEMPENAMMMIHDPSGLAVGTADDMRELADVLDKVKQCLVSAYRNKSGLPDDEIAELMAETTWLSAEEAKEKGFADAVTKAAKMAACADPDTLTNLNAPETVLAAFARQSAAIPETDNKESDMSEKDQKPAGDPSAGKTEADIKAEVEKQVKAERDRAAAINKLCADAGVHDMAETLVAEGIDLEAAQARVTERGDLRAACASAAKISKQIDAEKAEAEFVAAGTSAAKARAVLMDRIAALSAADPINNTLSPDGVANAGADGGKTRPKIDHRAIYNRMNGIKE